MAQQPTTTEGRTADKYTAALDSDGLATELERETDLYNLGEGAEVTLVYDSPYTDAAETAFTGTVQATGVSYHGSLTTYEVRSEDTTRCVSGFDEVQNIVLGRCSMCHAPDPGWPGLHWAPKGVRLDTPAHIAGQAREIYLQSGLTHAMPPANLSWMEQSEREAINAWYDAATGG